MLCINMYHVMYCSQLNVCVCVICDALTGVLQFDFIRLCSICCVFMDLFIN